MNTSDINTHQGAPGFASAVKRGRLLGEIDGETHPILLLSAPSGYGKSTLAQQIARQHRNSIWVDCSGAESDDALWAGVRTTLGASSGVSDNIPGLLPTARGVMAADVSAELVACIEDPILIVLDAVDDGAVLHASLAALETLVDALPVGSSVVVTTRATVPPLRGCRVHTMGSEALAMSLEETAELARRVAPQLGEGDVCQVHDVARGQAALIATLLRWAVHAANASMLPGGGHSDLGLLLRGMAESQLDAPQRLVLRAAAFIRSGWTTELTRLVEGSTPQDVQRVAACIPLLAVEHLDGLPTRFRLHDLAASVFDTDEWLVEDTSDLLRRCVQALEGAGRFDTVMRSLLQEGESESVAVALEAYGEQLLRQGHTGLLNAAVHALEPSVFVSRPRLLLLRAWMGMHDGRPADAIAQLSAALDLAEHDGDTETAGRALTTLARAQLDEGLLHDAALSMKRLLSTMGGTLRPGVQAIALGYLATCAAGTGDSQGAEAYLSDAAEFVAVNPIGPDDDLKVSMAFACVYGAVFGRWNRALDASSDALGSGGLSVSMELQARNNHANALLQLGRAELAAEAIAPAQEMAERYGVGFLLPVLRSTQLSILAAGGDYAQAIAGQAHMLDRDVGALDKAACLSESAEWLRAARGPEESLACAEKALTEPADVRPLAWQAILEMSASLLALGDMRAAQKRAESIRAETVAACAAHHALRADLILTEIERREGSLDDAVARIRAHHDYVLSENANWLIALYTRSFPHLLGIVATAVDPDDLPAHLLRLVLPGDREEALTASREVMDSDTWQRLAARLVSAEEIERLCAGDSAQDCHIRLFGGMSVKVGERTVSDREWRKRKARILFAMLALRQGRDVPRDQVLEHLWPDMDEERGRNNLYVIWSAMKSALSPEADKGTPCPYVENAGGVCRLVPELVTSDVDQFEELVSSALTYEDGSEHGRALEQYDQLREVYRGDLLPGDIYDDWFAGPRDHYRQEFADAMLRAAELSLAEEDSGRANRFARRGLDCDPWREDLYQVALKSQIVSGQRGAAVDTYFACKGKLSEDLGLDPSAETTRLYEQVLAMEQGSCDTASYHT